MSVAPAFAGTSGTGSATSPVGLSKLERLEQPINSGPPKTAGTDAKRGRSTAAAKNPEQSGHYEHSSQYPTHDAVEFHESPQPSSEDGVQEDMSTLAINAGRFDLKGSSGEDALEPSGEPVQDAAAAAALHLNGNFGEMDDAAIMLELKAGNMAGFDFLIQKYRKPIINFMYRMTAQPGGR